MIKKNIFYEKTTILILLLAYLAYEIHLKKYYTFFQMIISAMLCFLFLFFTKFEKKDLIQKFKESIKCQKFIYFMFFLMVCSTILGSIKYNLNYKSSFISVFLMFFCSIVLFYIIPLIMKENRNIEKKIINFYINCSVFLSIFSLLIALNHNSFLGYGLVMIRNASIYFDPNFLGMVIGVGFFLNLTRKHNKFIKSLYSLIILYAIIATGSRGTILSFSIAVMIYIFMYLKISKLRKVIIIIITTIALILGLTVLNKRGFFRTFQGSNGRTEMISLALGASFKEPIFGYGYNSIGKYLNNNGFPAASTHNSYIDYLFAYGYPCFIMYMYLILSILYKAYKLKRNNSAYLLPTIFIIFNANTILYSFGGVGLGSIMFTLLLGIINLENIENRSVKKNETI